MTSKEILSGAAFVIGCSTVFVLTIAALVPIAIFVFQTVAAFLGIDY